MYKRTVTRLFLCGMLAAACPFSTVYAAPLTKTPVQLPETGKPSMQDLFHGYWVNTRGSSLDLKENAGQLSGYFTTAVAKTRSCIGVPLAITGSTNKNAMAISFSLASCGSSAVIALTGLIMKDQNGKEQLRTQTLVQFNGKESWDSQVLTTDYYTRQEPGKKTSH
ncbi:hypothetical protein GZ77_19950 [Endozoicomonas montiporae]|uniref:Uncharacterized protein n=2 Tax=Endozoicomonas montiporae TaxID=1027273 RepID=A0A081N2R8_9GAMM|nr:avidin/streptavidin family protein [Endozoicomonas montiporae]AMO58007.1 hypothetical protein EZMO1_4079 [Endozoicomonas montiporae CL-33]KEQ12741.1 hypothetical protein GZ77_19950 [Endozoicomonas montiporae]